MSRNLSAKFRQAAGGAIGAGLGLAFASGVSGAQDLAAATAEFTAQTAASDAQAKEFEATLASLNKSSIQGIPEIGAALTALKLNFGLAGAASEAMGARFLDFSRIAGGTAADAVGRFDELVDSGVVSVEGMADLMDRLAVSHSRFGVDINGTIAALVKFAPAMRAAGISTDDALGLMNMFSEAGLSAETAAKAFNIALGKVKSPEELKSLMTDISATSDDFSRGRKAADLFGQRAGVQLANALKPGSGGIAAWSVSAEDAAGAVQRAGDALDADPFTAGKLWLKQLSGSLAEAGASMDGLLMAAAILGPGLTRGLLAGIGGIGGLLAPKIAAEVAAAGSAAGAAFSAATAAAILAAPAAVMYVALKVSDDLGAQVGGIRAQLPAFLRESSSGEIQRAVDGVKAQIAQLPVASFGVRADLLRIVDDMQSELERRAPGYTAPMVAHLGQGAREAARDVRRYLSADLAAGTPQIAAAMSRTGEVAGAAMDRELAAAAHQWRTTVSDGAAGAADGADAAVPGARRAAAGLGSALSGPVVDAAAEMRRTVIASLSATVAYWQAKWSEISALATGAAEAIYGPQIRKSRLSANAREQAEQRAILASHKSTKAQKKDAEDRLLALQQEGLGIRIEMAARGELAKTAYAALISELQKQAESGNDEVRASAALALAKLRELRAAGTGVPGFTWTPSSETGPPQAHGGPVSAGTLYRVNEDRTEWFRPAVAGVVLPLAPGAGGGGGGDTFHITVQPGRDTSLGAARRFGQAVADEVAAALREQAARSAS
jgi:hypothetical protein